LLLSHASNSNVWKTSYKLVWWSSVFFIDENPFLVFVKSYQELDKKKQQHIIGHYDVRNKCFIQTPILIAVHSNYDYEFAV